MSHRRLFLFQCSPHLTSLRDLTDRNMHFSDIAPHDITRDLILFNQQRMAEVELSNQLEQKKNEMRKLVKELAVEKQKTDELLYSMLPKEVAVKLKEGENVKAGNFEFLSLNFELYNMLSLKPRICCTSLLD